jgi:hypothetical protein
MAFNPSPKSNLPATLFVKATPTPSAAPTESYPHGLSQTSIISLIVVLPVVLSLALIAGALLCYRVRFKRNHIAQQKVDIEQSLQRARPPILALDTDIPLPMEIHRGRSASTSRLPTPYARQFRHRGRDVPPMPTLHSASAPHLPTPQSAYLTDADAPAMPALALTRSAPLSIISHEYSRVTSPMSWHAEIGAVRMERSPTRASVGGHAPGIGGRVKSQVRLWERKEPEEPMQIYDKQRRRTVYLG